MLEINDYKYDVIRAFSIARDNDEPIVIHTANSLIVGKIKNDLSYFETEDDLKNFISDNQADSNKLLSNITNHLICQFRENTIEKHETSEHIKGIWLEEVSIIFGNLNNKFNTDFYFVFLDQVVGVTFGTNDLYL